MNNTSRLGRSRTTLAGMLVVLAASFVFVGAACTKPTDTIKGTPPKDEAIMEKKTEKKEEGTMQKDEESAVMEKKEGIGVETPEQEEMEKKNAMMEKTDDSKMMEKSANFRYIPYSKAGYDASADKRRVLYFYATWCPSCKQANEDFTANSNKIPDGVIVLRVNYNDPDTDQEEKDLAKKYGVTYQHTYVQVDAAGNAITKWNGGGLNELIANIK